MKSKFLHFAIVLVGLLVSSSVLSSQTAIERMKKDYPSLMQLYGDRIPSQKAHYIFVVDVSSSMRPYEAVVKNNLLSFLKAVHDGDQVSLIKMSDERNTGFVGLLKCATLDPAIRSSIQQVVSGLTFNRQGSSGDGSDGFTMANCVLQAINTVGSNDLTFVYMLTDFEYWTHKNGYNKNAEDWNSLIGKLPEGKMDGMCKYGIELSTGNSIRQTAVFKQELDQIFGQVQYQAVGSAALLSNWFSHIETGVMSIKLNNLLKEDWNNAINDFNPEISLNGNDIVLAVSGTETPLIDQAEVTMRTNDPHIRTAQTTGTIPGTFNIGEISIDPASKSILPGYLTVGGNDCDINIRLITPYDDEISRLQGVCGVVPGQDGAINMNLEQSVAMPKLRTWNSVIPLWAWILIAAFVLIAILSVLYQQFLIKVDREWSVSVKGTQPNGETIRANGDALKAPFTFGGSSDADIRVKNTPWTMEVKGRKFNPLFVWRKSGYYLTLLEGQYADVDLQDGSDPVTISVGKTCFLYRAGQSEYIRIHIHERGATDYKIDLN